MYGDHDSRRIQRTWKNPASIDCEHHIDRRTNTDGDASGEMDGVKWYLVGNYNQFDLERYRIADMIPKRYESNMFKKTNRGNRSSINKTLSSKNNKYL